MRIALDAMGSDDFPAVEVAAAISAARGGHDVILVGAEPRIRPWLRDARGLSLEIVHASEVIGMDESPVAAARSKRDSSLRRCFDLVEEGKAQAVVSAGNSGAVMATALLTVGRVPGVERPAIATVFPTTTGSSVLLDIGANVDCRPSQLAQFAVMGATYARRVLGLEQPRVALLSNGTEEGKGNEALRETHALLKRSSLAYVGQLEGRDLFAGRADVLVCDGFVGNVVLKSMEGAAEAFLGFMRAEIARSPFGRLGAWLLRPSLRALRRRLDYAEYGGAPLLGVAGAVVICHGASSSRAVENAIHVAARLCAQGLVPALAAELARHADLFVRDSRPAAAS